MQPTGSRADIRARYLAVDTATVADVLDERGRFDQGLAAAFRPESGERLAGWAYTITGEMTAFAGDSDPLKVQACNGIGSDEISVWSGNGVGVCYFGELYALGMIERGSAGALVDGGVRDTRWLREHRFPVFARYHTPIRSVGRWRVTHWQQPVQLAGATSATVEVRPGDFVLADEDGVLIVPQAEALDVLVRSEELTATEIAVRAALKTGKTLAECLAEFGHI